MVPLRNFASRIRPLIGEVVDSLAALVFPAPCRICEATLIAAGRIPVCRECLDALRPLSGPACQQCGRPFTSALAGAVATPLCHACRRGVYSFDLARSWGPYDDSMARAITLLKYQAVTPLAGWFALRLAECVAREPEAFAVDVIVPVPLDSTRQRERGFNQAELIGRPLARRLHVPLRSYLLVRTRPRPAKLRLTRRERWTTVRGAYGIREGRRVDKLRVLLVDDVFTTGATLDACARALRLAGAARVIGLTVARVAPNWAAPRAQVVPS